MKRQLLAENGISSANDESALTLKELIENSILGAHEKLRASLEAAKSKAEEDAKAAID